MVNTENQWNRGDLLYEGKAKKIYAVNAKPDLLWVEYKNDLTAFNAQKRGSFDKKGEINSLISLHLYKILENHGIPQHFVAEITPTEIICQKLKMIPLEVVVRNRMAGSTAKKLGLEEGTAMEKPIVEFYYKADKLADPFVSDDQALLLRAADQKTLDELKKLGLKVSQILAAVFAECGLELIDFKTEWGFKDGKIILADEISPDCCRLWDFKTREKYDKDRFRRDLGGVAEAYQFVWDKLQKIPTTKRFV